MNRGYAFFVGAMGAAIIAPAAFHAVADDFAPAMFTFRGQRMDRAFKAIKVPGDAIDEHLDGLIVFVPADFTFVHTASSWFLEFTIQ